MARLIIVSNRLPITVARGDHGRAALTRASGGLATGMRAPHEESDGLWIGWPGDLSGFTEAERADLERQLAAERLVALPLDAEEIRGFYEGFSNGVLWPLFHYLLDHIPVRTLDWEIYRRVNDRFADAVAAHYRPGDLIWIHDYHLCLLPALLRARIPDARIGYFLHIPFPSSEVLQALPWRNALLEGLLGADLIGFHTWPYLRHFSNALLRLLGVASDVDRVRYRGRTVRLGAFPMGIDARAFVDEAQRPEVEAAAAELRRQANGQLLFLGVDRLDYTKGIRRRLLALEWLLEREPAFRGKVRLIQIGVPSRTEIDKYLDYRQQVEEMVGRVNGLFGTTDWVPIHYLYRSFSQRELVTFYRAADVMLVTPLRDGMNLVAKEFVAARVDERGALILSELAGAAAELGEALLVNPFDVEGVGDAMWRALQMSPREQTIRMRALRRRVLEADVHHWTRTFIETLSDSGSSARGAAPPFAGDATVAGLRATIAGAERRLFLLDCDGTLLALSRVPALIGPDAALRDLLAALARLPATRVELLSGRDRETLEEWFGDLPLGLHAEHGVWSRDEPGQPWRRNGEFSDEWRRARPILDSFAARTPGAFVEEKSAGLSWHYRMADPEYGPLQAKELRILLTETFANKPLEVAAGNMVVEVRPHGANKGRLVAPALERAGPGALVVAIGDDLTDEDMFEALPPGGIALHVGVRETGADHRLENPAAVRRFLRALVGADPSDIIPPCGSKIWG